MGGTVLALSAVVACSSSDTKSTGGGTGGSTSTGGKTGTGGSTGGGGAATGGSSGGAPSDPYTCFNAPPKDPGGTVTAGGACCSAPLGTGSLDLGSCVTAASITDPNLQAAYGHDKCTATPDLRCAPTQTALNLASTDAGQATGVFSTCRMTTGGLNLEGRCLPKCFVEGNPLANMLSQGTCKADLNQICAPCYNPLDGKATGACTVKSGDAPVDAAPTPFATCTGTSTATDPKLGTCVPKALADASGNAVVSALKQHDCANTTDICVPTLKADNLSACFPKCTVTNATVVSLGDQYKPGACVPKFAVADANPTGASLLGQETCQTGELCAPCLNPLSNPAGQPTGACE